MKIRALTASVLAVVIAATALQAVVLPERSDAAAASQFNPGLIISDALFFDGGAMSASTVQNFLNSQVTTCVAGYTCLKDYHQDTQTRAATPGRCDAYIGAANESAATIIARVGAACGISQKVLLVLTQKEVGLVTSVAPSSLLYRKAMGYGCPDTAPCDSLYYGFFNQVYSAASQFKAYAANPTHWNNIAGRSNTVLYSPKAGCGSSSVFIQNQATAGLYNYTPYQPDASALANLYGSGDACASYGNRNFWVYYTDWFGSTTLSSLVRTISDPGVYLVVGTVKYLVPNMEIFTALSPLGGVSFVSQSYLDGLTTSHPISRTIRDGNGTIYYIDSGFKLPFSSCALVYDYGATCDSTGFVQLTDAQSAAFRTGPLMTQILGTTAGTRYWVTGGSKREILDTASQIAAGLPLPMNVLSENAVMQLPTGVPIVRDSVFVQTRGTSAFSFVNTLVNYPIASSDAASVGVASRSAGMLNSDSISALQQSHTNFTGVVSVAPSSDVEVVSNGVVRSFAASNLVTFLDPVPVSQAVVDSYAPGSAISDGGFVKSAGNASVYAVTASDLRPISSWDALVALSAPANPAISTVPDSVITAIPKGSSALAPGTMYRTVSDPSVYLIDGYSTKYPVLNFDYPLQAGFTKLTFAPQALLDAYSTSASPLQYGVRCGGTNYVSAGGVLRATTPTTAPLFPFAFAPLNASTCSQAAVGLPAIDFIRTADGSVYQLVAGQKRPFSSMARLTKLNGGQGWMQVPDSFAAAIPTGAAA